MDLEVLTWCKEKVIVDLSKSCFGEAVRVQTVLGVNFVMNGRWRSEDDGMSNSSTGNTTTQDREEVEVESSFEIIGLK